ncbi:MAG TPA: SMP-30/gluconolactonase/LRE family protein, partial [Microvirga sp.]|nr:SMP-30/gluconolactonase/LRE family protein [Microvirga sp.]
MTHPIVHPQMPHVAVASACLLGEGPVWDERSDTLLWVDIKNPAVWRYRPETGEHSRVEAPERIGFIAFTPDPNVVIAGFKSGLGRFDLKSGESEPVIAPEKDKPG